MDEQVQQSGYQQSTVSDKLGYRSHIRQRLPEIDFYTNKGLEQSYLTYNEQLVQRVQNVQTLENEKDYQRFSELAKDIRNRIQAQPRQQVYATLMDLIDKIKEIQFKKIWSNQPSFEEWRKYKKDTEDKIYSKWKGVEEDINGDNFPEFVVRDDKGFIHSAYGLQITIPIKRQRVTKYFRENPSKEEGQEKHYKQSKEDDKPAKDYRSFIKKYLSPFLKERGYTVAKYIQSIKVDYGKELLLHGYCNIKINHINHNRLLGLMQLQQQQVRN
ncbi:MAG: hypothetical protein EZS28_009089 [Streblomastix strix]|uniref:Uncharacterized protein n=1 Tax=Streblomastix strix TaxID=222440 RepID=A0A5J4WK15_9EUKA|nr:MAG: hypothetical protein EZS28_009089 [Streblomastix strix]